MAGARRGDRPHGRCPRRNQGRILPCSVELQRELGVDDAYAGVPVKPGTEGAEWIFELELSAWEKDAFTKSVVANTELMTIARGFRT